MTKTGALPGNGVYCRAPGGITRKGDCAMSKKRVILIVLDSVGIGAAPDAADYGDAGADTLRHTLETTGIRLPNLARLGLFRLYPDRPEGRETAPQGACFRLHPAARGKDTTTGHWEMAGCVLQRPLPVFSGGIPGEVLEAFSRAIGTPVLGGENASGTEIIARRGEEHLRTGYPIVYTSADSVFQIAAHTDVCPLEKLYSLCEQARALLQGDWAVGRVIARPFAGEIGGFQRLPQRRDYSLPPMGETMLDVISRAMPVYAVGKIEDIFAHRGITYSRHSAGNPACIESALEYLKTAEEGLIFVNLVDFDSKFGHRRDAAGYGDALAYFDARLPELEALLRPEDLLMITADHGCDPTYRGTDHTREDVPWLIEGAAVRSGAGGGTLSGFSSIARTICGYLGGENEFSGENISKKIF